MRQHSVQRHGSGRADATADARTRKTHETVKMAVPFMVSTAAHYITCSWPYAASTFPWSRDMVHLTLLTMQSMLGTPYLLWPGSATRLS